MQSVVYGHAVTKRYITNDDTEYRIFENTIFLKEVDAWNSIQRDVGELSDIYNCFSRKFTIDIVPNERVLIKVYSLSYPYTLSCIHEYAIHLVTIM